jgi:UDP-N-acetylmuramoyl-tripeptide--D-alanyl-D-alanine ligase
MAELGSDAVALHEQAGQRARTAGCRRLFGFGENSRRAVQAFGPGGAHFDTIEALVAALRQAIKEECPTLLIKGSRSMRLERVVQALGATPFPAAKQEIQS